MNIAVPPGEPKRPYRQTARAETAEATARRIVEAFMAQSRGRAFEDIRLDEVAREAGVSVQTVIRRFGGKEGLLEAAMRRLETEITLTRETAVGDAAGAVRAVVADYEQTGPFVLHYLAQEDRHPPVRRMTDKGRAYHRAWLARVFDPWLDPGPDRDAEAARRRLDALVVATDLYVWKLVRLDMGRPAEEVEALMRRLVAAALTEPPSPTHPSPEPAA